MRFRIPPVKLFAHIRIWREFCIGLLGLAYISGERNMDGFETAALRSTKECHFDLPVFLAAMLGMAAGCLLVRLCYGNAERLVRVLGETGSSIVTRLSSFILLAIGVQIIWNGFSSALVLLPRSVFH